MEWKQAPESTRPSLRALARGLSTSHQLLRHYLDGLEKWRYKERHREATAEPDQILARAIVEDRAMTQSEIERHHVCTITAMRAKLASLLLNELARLKQEVKRGPLSPGQFEMLTIFAKHGFPEAQELMQKCSQVALKEKKRFAAIVRETPRQMGETYIDWVRRIWDQCSTYDTKCPRVITEELLRKYSQDGAKKRDDNLPAIPADAAKSFRIGLGIAGIPWQPR